MEAYKGNKKTPRPSILLINYYYRYKTRSERKMLIMYKRIWVLALVVFVALFAAGCNSGEETPQKPELQMGELEYETVDRNSDAFAELYANEDFRSWYEDNSKKEGISSFEVDEDRYILLSAGEKNTGGYSIDNIVISGKEGEIQVKADLNVPSSDSAVAQTVNYPQVLLCIPLDERPLNFAGFYEVEYKVEQELLQDTGAYVGQIDSNSVEIEISGVPKETAAKAFRLDESIKEGFEEKHGLQTGDKVSFTYFVDEYQRNVLKEIKKL